MLDFDQTYLISSNLGNGQNTTTQIDFTGSFFLRSLFYDSEAGVETIVKCGTTQISRTTGGIAKPPSLMNYRCNETPFTIFFQNTAIASNQIQAEFSYTMNTDATITPYMTYEFYQNGARYEYNPLQAQIGMFLFLALGILAAFTIAYVVKKI